MNNPVWIDDKGKIVEPEYCRDFLTRHPMPVSYTHLIGNHLIEHGSIAAGGGFEVNIPVGLGLSLIHI